MKAGLTLLLAAALVAAGPFKRAAAPPINAGALTLIEGVEGFVSNFKDVDGHQTIGFGHDCTEQGDCASIKAPLSRAAGGQLLLKDLTQFETCVCALPNANKLNANQYGALTSFAFNSGCGGVKKFFGSVMQSGNVAQVCSQLPTTNTLNGELSSRRQKEGAFCSQPTTASSGCGGTATKSNPKPAKSNPKPAKSSPKPSPKSSPKSSPAPAKRHAEPVQPNWL